MVNKPPKIENPCKVRCNVVQDSLSFRGLPILPRLQARQGLQTFSSQRLA